MKIAIISDTHFGDDTCTLVEKKGAKGNIKAGRKFNSFLKAAGTKNDYLVMAGDIFDFSVASYHEAYEYAQVFFKLIQEKGVAKEIIYLPGNHDADMWHIIQHQRAVINRLQRGKFPKQFEHSIPGVIYDKKDGKKNNGFWLHGVRPNSDPNKPKYGSMFLDKITGVADGEETNFNFAYPNLYIVTDQETVLVTHGQYLEPVWSFLGELVMDVAGEDLNVGAVDIEEMMAMNFPISQLLCTGVGQAGVLTRNLVRPLEQDVKKGDFTKVEKYLRRLEQVVDREIVSEGWTSWLKELTTDTILKEIRKKVLEAISSIEDTRYRTDFAYKPDVKKRFHNYYRACLLEIATINEASGQESGHVLPFTVPSRVIFGHTHDPISWNDSQAPTLGTIPSSIPKKITLHNSGGWLEEEGKPFGAEVFSYESGKGFSSTRVV